MTIIIPSPPQTWNGPGFVYTVEYECGNLRDDKGATNRGNYRTNILVHNNGNKAQKFFVKILSAIPTPPRSVWLRKEAFEIGPDGAADIDCLQILKALEYPAGTFSKGLVIISHPTESKTPFDVRASYTYLVEYGVEKAVGGVSKQVETIPGVSVLQVPTP